MILFRYLSRHIYKGSAMVLLILISLNLFYAMVRELDHVGHGDYGIWQMFQYLILKIPAVMVEFIPLAVLLGSILGLGSLASGSEIIAMQSSGVSVKKLVISVTFSAFGIALFSLLLANMVVPVSETYSTEFRISHLQSRPSMKGRSGVWIKDENNVIHIRQLYPDGHASGVTIYHLNKNNELITATQASRAKEVSGNWILQQVRQTNISNAGTSVQKLAEWSYQGKLSNKLLESLATDPDQMSIGDLSTYIGFLTQNSLTHKAESLFFWRKIYSPLGIIVMAVLAIPFVLGSQRQSNTGQRVLIGILMGLLYVVMNKLLIQLGEQLNLLPYINALLPTLFFIFVTGWLIRRKVNAI
jgi:lipopolysaccharide export system permease protein